jgi:CheY-like chemotaxis protein
VGAIRILIADSDTDSRTVYRIMLQYHGFEVLEAEDGESALERARTGGISVVVTELTLARLDGHGLLQRLKEDAQTRDIAVVVLTARVLREDEERARQAGCAAFLTKPLQPAMLLREIRTLAPAGD